MANRITAWCIDCDDPEALATFWSAVLEWEITGRDDEVVSIKPSRDAGWGIDFARVADRVTGSKNPIHLDLSATDRDQDHELRRLLDLGAQQVDIGQSDVSWSVLADPEGNEFCLLRSRVEPES